MQPVPEQKDPQKSKPPISEMIGATSAPFYIGPGTTQISFALHTPSGPSLLREGSDHQLILLFENITGDKRAPSFKVYLNVPHGEAPEQHPEFAAGTLGFFGLLESSRPNPQHGEGGLTLNLDVTDLVHRLMATKNWDLQNLRLSFVPGIWDAPVPRVKIGRVSLYLT